MSALPKQQRQWRQDGRGTPRDVLKLYNDAPLPTLEPGRVLVKISHATTSPVSWKVKMALFPARLTRGAVPELEATGWVEDPNGCSLSKGQAVWGCLDERDHFYEGKGVLTEYVAFKADLLIPIPPPWNTETAVGMWTNCITAQKSLLDVGKLQRGQKVFINGGTTAIGMAMIQLAKLTGAEVVVSCSEASSDLVRRLGADKVLDYRTSPVEEQLLHFADQPFDLIVDNIGNLAAYKASPAFLKKDGMYVVCGLEARSTRSATLSYAFALLSNVWLCPRWLGGVPRRATVCSAPISRERFEGVLGLIKHDMFENPIDSTYSSDRAGVMAAYDRGMSGRAKGKLAIDMRDAGEATT